jgi:hypothetical protein
MRRVTSSDRRSAADGHILIGGTGRAGTTLLVQWFTALGFDTGFDLDEAVHRVDPISHGGLEHSLGRSIGAGERMPYVAKSPWFGNRLGEYLDRGELRVRAMIVPMRDLFAAAESRRQVSQLAEEAGRDPLKHPGGAIGAGRSGRAALAKQEQRLARQFYDLVHALVRHDVPIHFLRFPDFARGEQDLYAALRPLLDAHGVTPTEARAALDSVLRPDLIHEFPTSEPEG